MIDKPTSYHVEQREEDDGPLIASWNFANRNEAMGFAVYQAHLDDDSVYVLCSDSEDLAHIFCDEATDDVTIYFG